MDVIGHVHTRVLLSLAVLVGVGSFGALTTWSSFTDSTGATHSVATGNVDVELGAPGTQGARLELGVPALQPGDTAQRTLDIANVGNLDLGSVALTTRATTSSALDSNATDGVQVAIDRCSTDWIETGVSPAFAYTCGGTAATVLTARALIGTSMTLANLALPPGGAADHLRVRMSLPLTAGNAFQSASSSLEFQFDAVQRSGRHL